MEYIIKGDTERFTDCLVLVCGDSKTHAENVLSRLLNNPTNDDMRLIKDHKNLKIEEVEDKDCWWNFNCD